MVISTMLNKKIICPNYNCQSGNVTEVNKSPTHEYWKCDDCKIRFATWQVDLEKVKK